jgi:hypothetical protein
VHLTSGIGVFLTQIDGNLPIGMTAFGESRGSAQQDFYYLPPSVSAAAIDGCN